MWLSWDLLNANTALVTKLYISLQAHPDADMDAFFNHEIHCGPSSLSDRGKLWSGIKYNVVVFFACVPVMSGPGHSPEAKENSLVILWQQQYTS